MAISLFISFYPLPSLPLHPPPPPPLNPHTHTAQRSNRSGMEIMSILLFISFYMSSPLTVPPHHPSTLTHTAQRSKSDQLCHVSGQLSGDIFHVFDSSSYDEEEGLCSWYLTTLYYCESCHDLVKIHVCYAYAQRRQY